MTKEVNACGGVRALQTCVIEAARSEVAERTIALDGVATLILAPRTCPGPAAERPPHAAKKGLSTLTRKEVPRLLRSLGTENTVVPELVPSS